jgi:Mg-chelatase subunit ChlD
VRKVVRDGTLIGPITEGIPFSALRFQRDLPEALHEIALGIHVQPTGRIRTTIGFPGLDVETIDSEVGESSGKQPHESGDTAVLIITDCSSSMGIECPPRIESARTATEKVVSDWGGRSGKQLGLVVFGMKTALVAPLGSTPEALIKAAAQMKAHGSTPMARAFEVAERAFSECDAAQKVAVVISDGSPNSFESAAAAAERLGKQARIYAIGVGENACEIFLKQIVSNESDYRHTSARGLVAELGRVVGPILSPAAHALTKGASNVAQ